MALVTFRAITPRKKVTESSFEDERTPYEFVYTLKVIIIAISNMVQSNKKRLVVRSDF